MFAGFGRLLSRLTLWSGLLLALAFFDELASGVSSVGAPDIHRAFPTSYAELTVVLLLVPGLLGLLLEPPLFLLADRLPRHWFIAGGTAVMALGFGLCAVAPTAWFLALALALTYVANGIAVNLAQASLIDLHPERRASTLARWTLLGLIGDFGTPALFVVLAWLGLGWRVAFALMAILLGVWALALARRPLARPVSDDEADEPPTGLWQALVSALRHGKLICWLFGMTLCDLLDEILVVLASLHLRDELGVSHAWTGVVMCAYAVGGAVGLVLVDRLGRRIGSARLLAGCSAACAFAFLMWLTADTAASATLLMLLVGATAAPLYPLASAQAYAALPGRSGAVLAAGHLFTPLSLMLPFVLGVVADRFGVVAALVLLIAQPIGLGLLAWLAPVEAAENESADSDQEPAPSAVISDA